MIYDSREARARALIERARAEGNAEPIYDLAITLARELDQWDEHLERFVARHVGTPAPTAAVAAPSADIASVPSQLPLPRYPL
ncbi:hypothetical protein [Azorhizobium caulinodans]|nr:hypothetical protein [Azorhizobium caulinodans]